MKRCFDQHLLARLICIGLIDQKEKIFDYFLKLFQGYCAIVIYVEDSEYLLEILFWGSIGHYVEDNHEFAEVDMAILIGVIHSEYVPLQLLCVGPRVALLHHRVEALPRDPPVRMLGQEGSVLDLHRLAVHGCVPRDEVDVLVGQDGPGGPVDAAHLRALGPALLFTDAS